MTPAVLTGADLVAVLGHFMVLSLLAVGGAIAVAPEMQRWLVVDRGWLSDAEFTSSVALAQAAPGPNLLFVAVVGWNLAGAPGVLATMAGILIPSTTLTIAAARLAREHRETRAVRSFVAGLAPLTCALLFATGYVLAEPYVRDPQHRNGALALVVLSAGVMTTTRASPLWLIGFGALLGAIGWA